MGAARIHSGAYPALAVRRRPAPAPHGRSWEAQPVIAARSSAVSVWVMKLVSAPPTVPQM
jgi:hypothetical protein